MGEVKKLYNPFPGLRPFKTEESHLFFGRDQQIHELLIRLRQNHFLAVLGTSGSGKSSLIRAGLLPALKKRLPSEENSWNVVIFRPGGNPIGNLAEELYKTANIKLGPELGQDDSKLIILETNLRRSALGLVEVVRQSGVWKKYNLLIVVDQFEELFRYKEAAQIESYADESAAFVKLLLNASNQKELPIFILITMRSEFLGDCSQFRDLPETINDSLYLVPRMTRDQRREAITRPISVSGAEISNRLVQRMLNDVGDDPDQLPILQHALMRTWDYWHSDHKNKEPLDLRHYIKIGELNKALTNHAEEALEELIEESSKIVAKKVFQCITVKGPHNHAIRRPTKMEDICNIIGFEEEDVIPVIENFRKKGCSFLMPPPEIELNQKSVIDISHESLIRKWPRLKKWVKQETSDKLRYLKLVSVARAHKKGEERLLRDPQLQIMLNWRKKKTPTSAWAQRYHQDYDLAINYLDKSKKRRDIVRMFLLVCIIVIIGIFAKSAYNWKEAQKDKYIQKIWSDAINALDNSNGFEALYNFAKAAVESKNPQIARYSKFSIQNLNKTIFLEKIINNKNAVKGITLSHDEHLLLSWDDSGNLKIWNISDESKSTVTQIEHDSKVNGALFSNDDSLILTWTSDKTIRLWKTRDGTLISEMINNKTVIGAIFSHDDKFILSWCDDGLAKLWQNDNKNISLICDSIRHNRKLMSPIFNKSDSLILTWGTDNKARLWNTSDGSLTTVPMEHDEEVNGAIFSKDEKFILTWSHDGTARLWRSKNGANAAQIFKHNRNINHAIISNDNKYIITCCDDSTVHMWNTERNTSIEIMKHDGSINGVLFNKNDSLILTWSDDKTARLWNVKSGKSSILSKDHGDKIKKACFINDEKFILALDDKDEAILWDARNGAQISQRIFHRGKINDIISTQKENLIISCSDDSTMRFWRINDFSRILMHEKSINGAVFNKNEDLILTWSYDGVAQLWHSKDGSPASLPMRHIESKNDTNFKTDKNSDFKSPGVISFGFETGINEAILSPDEQFVITWSATDSTVKLWHIDGTQVTTIKHNGWVKGATFLEDSNRILTWSEDSTAKVWLYQNGLIEVVDTLDHSNYVINAFGINNNHSILTYCKDDSVRIWNLDDGSISACLKMGNSPIQKLKIADGTNIILARNGDGTEIRAWDIRDESPIVIPDKKIKFIKGIEFFQNKNLFLTWNNDGLACLWNPKDGLILVDSMKHNGNILGATISKNKNLILTWGNDYTARLWRMTNSSRATQRIMKHEDAVKGAKFNSDESLILTWSDDQTARIWHTEDGSPAIPPMKHNGAVLGGTFCKSDSLILTWSNDGTARLWNVGTDYDFPKNYLPLLVEVVTGTKMDDDGKISVLGADEWNAKKQNYIEIAEKHLKECKYKNANLYLKQKEVWESN